MTIIKYLFSLVGLLLLAGTFYLYSTTRNFIDTALFTNGTVTELVRSKSSSSSSGNSSYTYKPVVEFTLPNNETIKFTSSTGTNPPSYSIGETVEVFYDEASPEKAKINSFLTLWGLTLALGFMGTTFTAVGLSFVVHGIRKSRKIEELKLTGSPVMATFNNVRQNRAFKVNGRHPYRIFAEWKDPMSPKIHLFKSENLWSDPTNQIMGDEITVLIDRNNPKKYYVDTSFLNENID